MIISLLSSALLAFVALSPELAGAMYLTKNVSAHDNNRTTCVGSTGRGTTSEIVAYSSRCGVIASNPTSMWCSTPHGSRGRGVEETVPGQDSQRGLGRFASQRPVGPEDGDGINAGMESELDQEALHVGRDGCGADPVGRDGCGADPKEGRDLGRGVPVCGRLDDLDLPRREQGEPVEYLRPVA